MLHTSIDTISSRCKGCTFTPTRQCSLVRWIIEESPYMTLCCLKEAGNKKMEFLCVSPCQHNFKTNALRYPSSTPTSLSHGYPTALAGSFWPSKCPPFRATLGRRMKAMGLDGLQWEYLILKLVSQCWRGISLAHKLNKTKHFAHKLPGSLL